jgi:hypothetical protein
MAHSESAPGGERDSFPCQMDWECVRKEARSNKDRNLTELNISNLEWKSTSFEKLCYERGNIQNERSNIQMQTRKHDQGLFDYHQEDATCHGKGGVSHQH